MSRYILITLFFTFSLTSCIGQSKLETVEFLIGTWKMEGKDSFEEWKKENNQLEGYSYKFKNENKVTTETLLIKIEEQNVIYEATVASQNKGRTIPFVLNILIKDKISFENLHHDFPKKIQYQKLSDDILRVYVLGENDKGFSYKLIRQ
ncbi:DUF6265 family protein [Aquimarina sp. 2201CG5-10]|uniref:DUF6265 family protein n=1 Tax=Aquimarina callyspongiae TaxID=3098150 RepID=UPI002AC9DA84|nr:DUF6265 family protein [Aquimarina sp. 2201CG5-10]